MHVGNSRITIWTCRAQRHENQGGSIDVVYEVLRSMIARVEVPRSILSILPLNQILADVTPPWPSFSLAFKQTSTTLAIAKHSSSRILVVKT